MDDTPANTSGSDLLVRILVIGFFLLIGLVTGALAKRKGYNFTPWFFAGGIIGLIALAFLPHANNPKLEPIEQRGQARKGNDIGKKIAIVSLALALIRLLASF